MLTRCCAYRIKATDCIRSCCNRYLSEVRHEIDTSPFLKPSDIRVPCPNYGFRVSQLVERQGLKRPLMKHGLKWIFDLGISSSACFAVACWLPTEDDISAWLTVAAEEREPYTCGTL